MYSTPTLATRFARNTRAGPGMQHPEHAELPAEEARISGELLERGGGCPKQRRVDLAWVGAGHIPQLGWHGKRDEEIRDGQETRLLGGQPCLARVLLAGRAMAVATGMIAVAGGLTARAGKDLAAQRLGATALNGQHGAALLG